MKDQLLDRIKALCNKCPTAPQLPLWIRELAPELPNPPNPTPRTPEEWYEWLDDYSRLIKEKAELRVGVTWTRTYDINVIVEDEAWLEVDVPDDVIERALAVDNNKPIEHWLVSHAVIDKQALLEAADARIREGWHNDKGLVVDVRDFSTEWNSDFLTEAEAWLRDRRAGGRIN